MRLTLEQMQEITRGVDRVEERDGYFGLYRFTSAQTEAYAERNRDLYNKSFATAGVRLAMRTDSRTLSFDFKRTPGASSRVFFGFDVYENGQMTAHTLLNGNEIREGRLQYRLGKGEKTVEVYLPWSARIELKNIELDDGAAFSGARRAHRMICFGDSITHGYDAEYPSLSYACSTARLLDADECNKGIGGEVFFPTLAALPDAKVPDYITVAYGTNDWSNRRHEELADAARTFYAKLSKSYPTARIFAISPVCRLDGTGETPFGAPCTEVDALLREMCEGLANVTVLNGWQFVPFVKTFFSDGYLHPNDLGFGQYALNLSLEILKRL